MNTSDMCARLVSEVVAMRKMRYVAIALGLVVGVIVARAVVSAGVDNFNASETRMKEAGKALR